MASLYALYAGIFVAIVVYEITGFYQCFYFHKFTFQEMGETSKCLLKHSVWSQTHI